jgi:hypothetical protein
MAKNEGTVTISIDRYIELTNFVKDEELYATLKKDNDDFARHNDALQKRIHEFNNKPWYQRVFKSKV